MSIPETGGIEATRDTKTPAPLPSKESTISTTLYMDDMGTEMVDIYVGPSKVLFRLYKTKICSRISYFDKMFNGNFKEASSSTAYLPEDDPASFDLLADWANHPTVSKSPRRIRNLVAVKDANGEDVASWDPVGFYSLAEKYCLPELQDIIMDATIKFHKKMNELPSVDFVIRAYESTSVGSPLAEYCMRAMVYIMRGNGLEEAWEGEGLASLYELPAFREAYVGMQRAVGPRGGQDPRKFPRCSFHAHEEGGYCVANRMIKISSPRGKKGVQNKRVRVETSDSAELTGPDSD